MKIEVGKYYVTRDGSKVGPMMYNLEGNGYLFIEKKTGIRYRSSGVAHGGDPRLDLVAEWTDTPSDDKPKTWGEMTDAEKGAPLLARLEGRVVESNATGYWMACDPIWQDGAACRIKPAPVVREVVMSGRREHGWAFTSAEGYSSDTHRLTMPTIDGELIPGEYTGPDGRVIKVEATNDQ